MTATRASPEMLPLLNIPVEEGGACPAQTPHIEAIVFLPEIGYVAAVADTAVVGQAEIVESVSVAEIDCVQAAAGVGIRVVAETDFVQAAVEALVRAAADRVVGWGAGVYTGTGLVSPVSEVVE